jgi:hypothetical protein
MVARDVIGRYLFHIEQRRIALGQLPFQVCEPKRDRVLK